MRKSKSISDLLAELIGAPEKGAAKREHSPAPSLAGAKPDPRAVRRLWRERGDQGQAAKRKKHRGIDALGARYGRPVLDRGGWRVLWSRMAPGRWYDRKALAEIMPEYAEGSMTTFATRMVGRGAAERGLNPSWDGIWRHGPRYLYRRLEVELPAKRPHGRRKLPPGEAAKRIQERNRVWWRSEHGKAWRRNYYRERAERGLVGGKKKKPGG